MMKNSLTIKPLIYSLIAIFLFSSCQNWNNTQKGAAIGTGGGAAIGSGIGAIAGGGKGAAWGAIAGAVIGGVAGSLIGNKMDKQAREIETNIPGATVERIGEGIKVVLNENAIRFDFDKATLTAQAKTNLNKIITVFKDYPDTNIHIYGYTDNVGAQSYNLKLSERRAKSVADYLTSNGIYSSRITTQGFGIEDPIADNGTDSGRAENRRVEFAITANNKMKQEAEEGK